jgi:DNA-binding NtrC family response regulator
MLRRCRLLVAVREMGYAHVRRALHADFDLVVAYTHSQALSALKEGVVDAILCSIHFDESRMLDFLVAAKQIAPDIPFICCQVLATNLQPQTIQATVSAAESKGALGFIDYNGILRGRGASEADKALRHQLQRLLPPDPHCAMTAGT